MRNRIGTSSADFDDLNSSDSLGLCAIRRVQISIEHQVCLFGPERYEPKYQYPLMVWLHSCHSSEGEIENVMPDLSLQNYVGCAPRAPIPSEQGIGRFVWGRSATATAVAEEVVFAAIEAAAEQFSINRQRIFLAGFGSGGSAALRLGLRYPQKFAGVISIAGNFPNEQCALPKLAQAKQLSILWMYGEHSSTCNIQRVCESLPLLHSAGLCVDIRQYPCADDLLSNMLSDANGWMMEQVTNQPAVEQTASAELFSEN